MYLTNVDLVLGGGNLWCVLCIDYLKCQFVSLCFLYSSDTNTRPATQRETGTSEFSIVCDKATSLQDVIQANSSEKSYDKS